MSISQLVTFSYLLISIYVLITAFSGIVAELRFISHQYHEYVERSLLR